ncbi:hypothetical protein [Streptomyces sp. NBC_01497]|uniref:hypothetical protein n=1 Tax=Streptomyces sp. NBC_01497 TaxID=2903885 RepID=UPI002E31B8E7|nr:hypothetical protein [Streptomyces sp. NBC_01497]
MSAPAERRLSARHFTRRPPGSPGHVAEHIGSSHPRHITEHRRSAQRWTYRRFTDRRFTEHA